MKFIVEIDARNHSMEDYEADKAEWHPLGDDRVSIDKTYLMEDPTDDSFVLFRLIDVKP